MRLGIIGLPQSGKTTVFDTVIGTAEYARRVFHGLFMTDVRAAGAEIGDVGALVVGRDF